jgi:peptidyl-prolyl cis-trans isomerase SurA
MRDSMPMIPVQVELFHIVKYIVPDTTSKENTISLAKRVRDSLLADGDFREFAKKYSGDVGSVADGGDLGWVEKGKFVAEFERAAFALQVNEISMPIESPFGFHVIKLLEKNKDSIHCSHILFKLIQSDDDILKVKTLLDSVRQIAVDSNNFELLAIQFSEDKDTKGFGGSIGKIPLSEVPYSIANSVKELNDGEISIPAAYSNDPTKQGMSIVWRKRTIPEHKANLDDDYDFLKQAAQRYKVFEQRAKWISELKNEIYWEVFN